MKREILFQSSDYKLEKREGRKEGRMGGEREREKEEGREGRRKEGWRGREGEKSNDFICSKDIYLLKIYILRSKFSHALSFLPT